MHSPADILCVAMVDVGVAFFPNVGSLQDWQAFVARFPDQPDNAICVFDTSAVKDGRDVRTRRTLFHPGIQCRVRSRKHVAGYAKAYGIQQAWDAINNRSVAIDGSVYVLQAVHSTSGIIDVSDDDEERSHFTLNATLTIKGYFA